jgi:hypothetical protein
MDEKDTGKEGQDKRTIQTIIKNVAGRWADTWVKESMSLKNLAVQATLR